MLEFFEAPRWARPLIAEDEFLKRIHPDYVDKRSGDISPSQFRNFPKPPYAPEANRFSVDWAEFSSVDAVLGDTKTHGVIAFKAQALWVAGQEVLKSPLSDVRARRTNVAHCDVVGDKQEWVGKKENLKTAAIVRLAESARWVKREA